jgi:hypothetical protein
MYRTTLMLAAAMTVGGFIIEPSLYAATPIDNAALDQRDKAAETADVNAVRTLIGNSTDAAVRENGFNDLAGNFAVPSVNPGNNPAHLNAVAPAGNQGQTSANGVANAAVGDLNTANNANTATSAQTDKLNDQIRLFREAYKNKYGQEFEIKDAQTLFGDITAANLAEAPAQPAAAEIPAQNQSADAARPVQNPTPAQAVNSPEWQTLTVPEHQGAPGVTIHLFREGSSFKYATVHQANEQVLATSLTDCLTRLNNDQSHWPADANVADRLVGQHVLIAIRKTQEAEANAARPPMNSSAANGQINSAK